MAVEGMQELLGHERSAVAAEDGVFRDRESVDRRLQVDVCVSEYLGQ